MRPVLPALSRPRTACPSAFAEMVRAASPVTEDPVHENSCRPVQSPTDF